MSTTIILWRMAIGEWKKMCIHTDKLTVVEGLHNRTACCISRGCALYYIVVVTRYSYNYYTSRTGYASVRISQDAATTMVIIILFYRFGIIRDKCCRWSLISQRTATFLSADREFDRYNSAVAAAVINDPLEGK